MTDEELVTLWRPTGPEELELVGATGSTRSAAAASRAADLLSGPE
jgi:hypothetical protein